MTRGCPRRAGRRRPGPATARRAGRGRRTGGHTSRASGCPPRNPRRRTVARSVHGTQVRAALTFGRPRRSRRPPPPADRPQDGRVPGAADDGDPRKPSLTAARSMRRMYASRSASSPARRAAATGSAPPSSPRGPRRGPPGRAAPRRGAPTTFRRRRSRRRGQLLERVDLAVLALDADRHPVRLRQVQNRAGTPALAPNRSPATPARSARTDRTPPAGARRVDRAARPAAVLVRRERHSLVGVRRPLDQHDVGARAPPARRTSSARSPGRGAACRRARGMRSSRNLPGKRGRGPSSLALLHDGLQVLAPDHRSCTGSFTTAPVRPAATSPARSAPSPK